jgi:hypothetical protein
MPTKLSIFVGRKAYIQNQEMTDYQNFINEHSDLFWSVSPQKREAIGTVLLVETILNYGSLKDTQQLIDLLGLDETASVFFNSIQKTNRHNYKPEVETFFRYYFNRHVPQYSI